VEFGQREILPGVFVVFMSFRRSREVFENQNLSELNN